MEKTVDKVFTSDIINDALVRFNLGNEFKKLGDFENYVFETHRHHEVTILRFTHDSHRSKEQLLSELDWMRYLHDKGVNVPHIYESINGELVESFPASDGTLFYGSVFSKVPGEGISVKSERFQSELFFSWGKMIGKMHKETKGYTNDLSTVGRPHWDEEDLLRLENHVPSHDVRVVENTKILLDELHRIEKNIENFGLIHTDIHSGNFFYDGKEIHVFDFDDCCYHWFSSDIAIPLYYSCFYRYSEEQKEEMNTFAESFLQSFVCGYRTENPLPKDWDKHLPLFLRLRDITLYSVLHKKIAPEDRTEFENKMLKILKRRIEANEPIVDITNMVLNL